MEKCKVHRLKTFGLTVFLRAVSNKCPSSLNTERINHDIYSNIYVVMPFNLNKLFIERVPSCENNYPAFGGLLFYPVRDRSHMCYIEMRAPHEFEVDILLVETCGFS